ncbi:MAG TPA: hypothetical protein VGL77_04550 [Armatimonadota bacterium]|jgi:hypothetical protein
MVAKHQAKTGSAPPPRAQWAFRYFLAGQLGFWALLLVCVLLLPQGLLANHGFTYYGKYALTLAPYRLAFIVSGLGTLLASFYLPAQRPFRVLAWAFRLMAPLLYALVVTTAADNWALGLIHVKFGETLFLLQTALAAWLALFLCPDRRNRVLLLLLVLGGLASIITLNDILPYLIEAQILFQLAFGLLVLQSLAKLGNRAAPC